MVHVSFITEQAKQGRCRDSRAKWKGAGPPEGFGKAPTALPPLSVGQDRSQGQPTFKMGRKGHNLLMGGTAKSHTAKGHR